MTDRDNHQPPFEAFEVSDELREQLWELAYGLLDDEAAEALCEQVTSNPHVARAYAEVQLEVEQVAACAKLQSAPIDLAPSPAAARQKAAGQQSQQWSAVLVALAACLLLVLTAYPLLRGRPDPASLARRAVRLTASGPSQVIAGRKAVYRVQARSPEDDRLLLDVPVRWSLVGGEQEQELARGSQRTSDRGEARIELTSAQLARGGTLQLTGGDESPPVELEVRVVPETFATALTVDSDHVLPGHDVTASLLVRSETMLQELDEVRLNFGLQPAGNNSRLDEVGLDYDSQPDAGDGQPDAGNGQPDDPSDGLALFNGKVALRFKVPPDTRPGRYLMLARNDRYDIIEAEQLVEVRSPSEAGQKSVEQNLQGTLEFYDRRYASRDKIVADYLAVQADGTPLRSAKVAAEAKDREGRRAFQMFGRTDSNGAFQVHLPPSEQAPLETLSVRVQDEAGTVVTEKEIPAPRELRVQWYPEGGTLAAALPGRVFFRATDEAGQPQQVVRGVLLDEQGDRVILESLQLDEQGRGQFRFTPRVGEVYRASLVAKSGLQAYVTLSADSNQSLSLDCGGGVFADGEPIEAKLVASREQRLLLVARCRGAIVAEQRLSLQPYDPVDVSLATESWEPWAHGTVRLSAYAVAEPQTPLAERLVFCQRPETRPTAASADVALQDAAGERLADGAVPRRFLLGREVAPADRDPTSRLLVKLPGSAPQLNLLLGTQELVEQPYMEQLARADNRGQAEQAYRALWAAAAEADQHVLRTAGLVGLAAAVAVLLVLGLTAILNVASWRVWAPALAVASLCALLSVAWIQQPPLRGPPALAQAEVDEEAQEAPGDGFGRAVPRSEPGPAETAAKKAESEGSEWFDKSGPPGRKAAGGDQGEFDPGVAGSLPGKSASDEESFKPPLQPDGRGQLADDADLAPLPSSQPAPPAAAEPAPADKPAMPLLESPQASAGKLVPDGAASDLDAAVIALGEPLTEEAPGVELSVTQRGRQKAPGSAAAAVEGLRGGAEGPPANNRPNAQPDPAAPTPAPARDASGFGGGGQQAGQRARTQQPSRESVAFSKLELTYGDELRELPLADADAKAAAAQQNGIESAEEQFHAYNEMFSYRAAASRASGQPRIVPLGFPQALARAGSLPQGATAWDFQQPADQTPGSLRATLVLYPSVQSQLRAAVEALDQTPQLSVDAVASLGRLQALALADMQQNRLPDPHYVRRSNKRMDRLTRQLAQQPAAAPDAGESNGPASGQLQLAQNASQAQRPPLLGTLASEADFGWKNYFSLVPSAESGSESLSRRLGGEPSANGHSALGMSADERLAELKQMRSSSLFSSAAGARAKTDALASEGESRSEAQPLAKSGAAPTFDTLARLHGLRHADGAFGSARDTERALQEIAAGEPRPPRQDQEVRIRVDGEQVRAALFETGQADPVVIEGLEEFLKAESRVEVESTSFYAVPYLFSQHYMVESRPSPQSPLEVSVQADREIALRTEVEVQVEVRNGGSAAARHVIARIGLPTGLQVADERLPALQKSGAFDAFEVRGREVRLAWTEVPAGDAGAKSLTLPATAVLAGSFTGPPSRVYAEAFPQKTSWTEPLQVRVTSPPPAAR